MNVSLFDIVGSLGRRGGLRGLGDGPGSLAAGSRIALARGSSVTLASVPGVVFKTVYDRVEFILNTTISVSKFPSQPGLAIVAAPMLARISGRTEIQRETGETQFIEDGQEVTAYAFSGFGGTIAGGWFYIVTPAEGSSLWTDYTPAPIGTTPAPPADQKGTSKPWTTTEKVLLGVGIAAALGLLVWALTD